MTGLDGLGISGDVDGAVALGGLEDGEGVEGGGVFDVAGCGVEAGSVPGAGDLSVVAEDALNQGGAVVTALALSLTSQCVMEHTRSECIVDRWPVSCRRR